MQMAPSSRRGANAGPSGLLDVPELERLWSEPRVLAAVSHLLAGDVTLVSADGRDPPAGHGQQGLHVDWPEPVAPGEHLLVNAFWVLDNMDETNGATRIVPRTHRCGKLPIGPIAQPHARHAAERVLCAGAGDVLVVSAHLWHSGTRNRSGRRRRLLSSHFATAAAAVRLRRGAGLT